MDLTEREATIYRDGLTHGARDRNMALENQIYAAVKERDEAHEALREIVAFRGLPKHLRKRAEKVLAPHGHA